MKKDQSQFLSLVLWGTSLRFKAVMKKKGVRIYSAPLLRKHNF